MVRRFAAKHAASFAEWLLYVEFDEAGRWRYIRKPGHHYPVERYGPWPARWGNEERWSTSPDHTIANAERSVATGGWVEVTPPLVILWDNRPVWEEER